MIAALLTLPARVHTPGQAPDEVDAMGEVLVAPAVTQETLCWLEQVNRAELRAGGLVEASSWKLYLPPGLTLSTESTVEVEGLTFTFEGRPWLARDPLSGVASHFEATVRLVQ